MSFASGSVSFRRFLVVGESPQAIDQDLLDKLAEHALKERDLGVPDEVEYGWSGGRHVLDGNFSFENNVFADALSEHALRPGDIGVPEEVEYGWSGGRHVLDAGFSFEHNVFGDALTFGLRVDTNKVPGDLKKAYQILEEDAVAKKNPSGFLTKQQKKEVKDTVQKKVDEELKSGRFRRSKLTPCLWDFASHTLYTPASSATQEKLQEIFERTFGLELVPRLRRGLAQLPG